MREMIKNKRNVKENKCEIAICCRKSREFIRMLSIRAEGPSSRYGACAAMQRRRSAQRRATGGGVAARALSRREARAIAAARQLSQDVDVSRGAPFGRCRSVSVPRIHALRLIALCPQTPRFWGKRASLFYIVPPPPLPPPSLSSFLLNKFYGSFPQICKRKRKQKENPLTRPVRKGKTTRSSVIEKRAFFRFRLFPPPSLRMKKRVAA